MANSDRLPVIELEDARIMFRNFAGEERRYNNLGRRNFCVVLDERDAEQLATQGFNVKYLDPREEGDTPTPYLKVNVSYKMRPPKVVMVTSRARQHLTESTLEVLDWADIEKVDISINPSNFTNADGDSGISAYLKTMYVIVQEDAIERKWAEMAIEEPRD